MWTGVKVQGPSVILHFKQPLRPQTLRREVPINKVEDKVEITMGELPQTNQANSTHVNVTVKITTPFCLTCLGGHYFKIPYLAKSREGVH